MTRRITAAIAVSAIAAMVLIDSAAARPNPYVAPHWIALGSGQSGGGGFCGAIPD